MQARPRTASDTFLPAIGSIQHFVQARPRTASDTFLTADGSSSCSCSSSVAYSDKVSLPRRPNSQLATRNAGFSSPVLAHAAFVAPVKCVRFSQIPELPAVVAWQEPTPIRKATRVKTLPAMTPTPGPANHVQVSQIERHPEALDRSPSPERLHDNSLQQGLPQKILRPRTRKIPFSQIAGRPRINAVANVYRAAVPSAYQAASPQACRPGSPPACRALSPPACCASPPPKASFVVSRAASPVARRAVSPVVTNRRGSFAQPMDFMLPGSGAMEPQQNSLSTHVLTAKPVRVSRVPFSVPGGKQDVNLAVQDVGITPRIVRPSRAVSDVGLGAGKALNKQWMRSPRPLAA